MKQSSLLDRPVWVLMCRVRSEGFLKLLGQTAHWLTNLFFSRTISSRVFICDTRSFSAMLFRRTFSDKVLEDSGRRGFVSFSDDKMSKDLPFSVRFLHYDTANVRFVLVDQVQVHNNNTYNVKSCQKYWWFNHCKQLSGHRYNVYDLLTRKLKKNLVTQHSSFVVSDSSLAFSSSSQQQQQQQLQQQNANLPSSLV